MKHFIVPRRCWYPKCRKWYFSKYLHWHLGEAIRDGLMEGTRRGEGVRIVSDAPSPAESELTLRRGKLEEALVAEAYFDARTRGNDDGTGSANS